MKTSSRKSASGIMRAAAGRASITTVDWQSQPTVSLSPKGRGFPPQDHVPPLESKNLPFPVVIDPEALPIRPQRHVPNSIATIVASRPPRLRTDFRNARTVCAAFAAVRDRKIEFITR
jgi:hypothetical protein